MATKVDRRKVLKLLSEDSWRLQEIASAVGLSRERVRQIREKHGIWTPRKCLNCGTGLSLFSHGRRIYCSPECRRTANYKKKHQGNEPFSWKKETQCEKCGATFLKRVSWMRFCSPQCSQGDKRSICISKDNYEFIKNAKGADTISGFVVRCVREHVTRQVING